MTDLRAAAHDYLTIRRRLGFELKQPGRTLEDFVEFMERAGVERVTTELALMWATSVQAHPTGGAGGSGSSAASLAT